MKTRTVLNIPPVITGPCGSLSDSFYERAIRFFKAQPDATPRASHIWNNMRSMLFAELEQRLTLGEVEWVKAYLSNLYERGCVKGMDHGTPGIDPKFYADELVALAYCCGTLRVSNIAQEADVDLDCMKLLQDIRPVVPFQLHWSGKCGGVPGITYAGKLIPIKLIEAAQLVVTADRLIPLQAQHILEIGAGTGFNAYGFGKTYTGSHYYIVDLPVVCVLQAFLLSSAFGEGAVSFYGEPKNEINISGLEWPTTPSFDLILNRNSFPEILEYTANHYMNMIGLSLKKEGVFISLNHEAITGGQVPVSELAKSVPTLKCTGRSPWWPMAGGWEGYVLETFKKI